MRRLILLICIITFILTSCADVQDKEYTSPYSRIELENLNDEMLKLVEDSYKDMELTDRELEVLEYYRKNELVVGQYVYPYYYENYDGENIGVNYFIIAMLEKVLDINVKTVTFDLSELDIVKQVYNIDIIPGVYDNADFKKSTTYGSDYLYLYSKDYDLGYQISEAALRNSTIGVMYGSEFLTEDDKTIFGELGTDINVKIFESVEEANELYKNDEIDYILQPYNKEYISNGFSMHELINHKLYIELYIGANDEEINEELIDIINKLDANTTVSNYMTYFEMYKNASVYSGEIFSEEEKEVIENIDMFESYIVSDNYPISYYSGDKAQGSAIEIVKQFAYILGKDYKIISDIEDENRDSTQNLLDKNEPIYVGMLNSSVENNTIIYSEPFFETKYVILGDEKHTGNYEYLYKEKIGLVESTNIAKYMETILPQKEFLYFDSQLEVIDALESGDVDYVPVSENTYKRLINEEGKYNLLISDYLDFTAKYSVGFENTEKGEILSLIYYKIENYIDVDGINDVYMGEHVDVGSAISERLTIIYVFLFVIMLAIIVYVLDRREKRKKEIEYTQKIEFANHQLEEIEKISGAGSWVYDAIKGEFDLSINFLILNEMEASENIILSKDKLLMLYKGLKFVDNGENLDFNENFDKFFFINEVDNIKDTYIREYSIMNQKKELMYNRTFFKPVFVDGKLIKILGITVDVTSDKLKEQELVVAKDIAEEASASQSRFVANMSHEIRTPLNAILGYSEILKSFNKDEKLDYYLDSIDTSGNILLNIVTDILDFAKVNAGKYTAHYIPYNIGDFLEEIKILFWQKISMKDLDFELIYDVDTPTLILPVSIIRQVVINLLGNAIKFTDDGSVMIKVVCKEKNGKYDIDIMVIDTGIGISDDKKEFIFIAFEQAEESHQKTGTGLGLAIATKFAQVIGGEISLESEIGKGSTFTIGIEDIEASEINIDSVYNKNEEIDFKFSEQKVMIVDDIKDNRDVLRSHCHNLNLNPKTYFSAKDALKNIDIFKPDIILTDLRMPVMSGEEFARQVRERNNDIPILCITASIDPEKKYELKYFNDVLNKPIASSILAKTMCKYLDTKEKDAESTFDIDTVFKTMKLTDDEFKDLKDRFYRDFKSLKGAMKPKKVAIVAKELIFYGEESKIDVLKEIGEKLQEVTQSLNIVVLMETINNFVDYFERE